MIKRALAATLCLMLVFALLPKTARAAAPSSVVINGVQLKDNTYYVNNKTTAESNEPLGWNAHYKDGVLTLRGLNVDNCATEKGISASGGAGETLTIKLEDDNHVSMADRASDNSYAIYADGCNLDIIGDGTLTASGGKTTSGSSYGMYINGSLTKSEAGIITAIGDKATAAVEYSYGVFVKGSSGTNSISVTGGSITGRSDGATRGSYGVYLAYGNIDVDGGSITGTGGEVTDADFHDFNASFGVLAVAGDITAENGSITGTGDESKGDRTYGVYSGNNIVANSGGTITGTGGREYARSTDVQFSYGLYAEKDITANSGGMITGTGGEAGTYCAGVFSNIGNVTVNGGTIIGVAGGRGASLHGVALAESPLGTISFTSGRLVGEINRYLSNRGAFSANPYPAEPYYWRMDKEEEYTTSDDRKYTWTEPQDYVDIRTDLPTIAFTTHPSDTTVTQGSIAASLTAAASTGFGDEVTLKWYACKATGEIDQDLNCPFEEFWIPANLTAGTYYYLCRATCWGAEPKLSKVATVTVMPKTYEITQGQHGQWLKGSGKELGFTADADYSKFTNGGSVSVDGSVIAGSNYTSQSGSTIVTLNAAYLETLSAGRHTLRINFTDGYAETDFIIHGAGGVGGDVGSDVPKTGDAATPVLWLGLILLAGAGLAVSAVVRRKRQNG